MVRISLILTIFYCLTTYSQERFTDIDGQRFHIKYFRTNETTVIFER